MSVQTTTITGGASTQRLAAGLIWCGGAYATYAFLAELLPDWTGLALLGIAFVAQIGFTFLESPIWRGRGNIFNYTALIVDVFTNVGGLYFVLLNLPQTTSYQALAAAFGVASAISPTTAFLLATLVGAFIAAMPENIWRGR